MNIEETDLQGVTTNDLRKDLNLRVTSWLQKLSSSETDDTKK